MPLNLIFIQPGNYTIEDNGVPGDNTSVIRDGNGVVIFTFAHPADALGFTVTSTGVNVTTNFTDTMGAANYTLGSLDPDPLVGPPATPDSVVMKRIVTTGTVTLVSNGSITEGGADLDSDVTAGALIMSAVSRIGTSGNAIETRTGLFEAETTTGGINIRNIGSVQIGSVDGNVDGLDVGTSGNINFVTVGSIFLTEANSVAASAVVQGGSTSGNVTLVASGANSDIIGNVDNSAVIAPRGTATLTAGRDIQLGTIGADFNNDVLTNDTLTLNAGRDILIDGFADIISDNFGLNTGGDIILNAGRNIGILELAGTSASVTASGSGGGSAIVTTGTGGALTVNAPGSFALGSTSGDVIASADRVLIDTDSGISATSGRVTIRPATDGREMILGSATDAAFALELSDAELDRIFTPSLFLGGPDAGAVAVSASISPANVTDVTIQSGTDIVVNAGVTVTATDDLRLQAGDNLLLAASASLVAGGTITGFVDVGNTDPGTGGTAFVDAGFTSAVRFFGEADSDTLFGGQGNDLLNGAGGADTLTGRLGNDTYEVDNFGDTVVEAVAQGTDLVRSSVSHTLAANVEDLILTGSANTNGTGNDLGNTLTGNGGNNVLNGGLGADTMAGGKGDDGYIVDNVGDVVIEASGAGTDSVESSVSFSLGGKQVENLTLTGSGNIDGTGNSFANIIRGNLGNNLLNGGTGSDTLTGAAGADTFRFNSALGATNIDSITDFNVAADTIQLENAIFSTIVGTGVLTAAQFRANATGTAQDANDRIVYDTNSGELYFDSNGNAAGGRVQFAELDTGLALTASDFFVI